MFFRRRQRGRHARDMDYIEDFSALIWDKIDQKIHACPDKSAGVTAQLEEAKLVYVQALSGDVYEPIDLCQFHSQALKLALAQLDDECVRDYAAGVITETFNSYASRT